MKLIETILKEYDNKIIGYHGSYNKFNSFNDSDPIFFVDNPNVAKTYGSNIISAELTLNNPIELDFDGNSTYYFFDKWYLPSDLAKKIKEISSEIESGYSLDDDLSEYLEYLDFSEFSGELDGIIMKNIRDSFDAFSDNKPATNYVVFSKSQINIKP